MRATTPNQRVSTGLTCGLGMVLLLSVVAPAWSQILVEGAFEGPNVLTFDPGKGSPPQPVSGEMTNTGDLFVGNDVEVARFVYLNGTLIMRRQQTPSESDQFVFFADNGDRFDEALGWISGSLDQFLFSDDIALRNDAQPEVRIEADDEGELQLFSESPEMRFLIDSDADDDATMLSHIFTWSNNNLNGNQRAMILQSNTGAVGNLVIAGTLTENFGFDLAESFWSGEPMAPASLVAVDPLRPDAVVLATDSFPERVLGVVSTKPGVLMGGGAFSVEALRQSWGDRVVESFESVRSQLEAEALGVNPALARDAERLRSLDAFVADLPDEPTWRVAAREALGEDGPQGRSTPGLDPQEVEAAYHSALESFETHLFDATMALFFDRNFAPVAISGRVPVRVSGRVEVGDPLTIGPVPGVAVAAVGSGPTVGTALESNAGGEGVVLMFAHRSWVSAGASVADTGVGDDRDESAELAELRAEVAALRAAVRELRQTRTTALAAR